jgi:gamma-glutamyltranspeptidase
VGDTRFHFQSAGKAGEPDTLEAEQSFPSGEAAALQRLGWKVVRREAPGTGHHFGGITAVEFNADGTLTGFADPRRTNAAAGY